MKASEYKVGQIIRTSLSTIGIAEDLYEVVTEVIVDEYIEYKGLIGDNRVEIYRLPYDERTNEYVVTDPKELKELKLRMIK